MGWGEEKAVNGKGRLDGIKFLCLFLVHPRSSGRNTLFFLAKD